MPLAMLGGCACGMVRYEMTEEPVLVLNCHCRDCQRFSGSASASGMLVPVAGFQFTKGTPRYHASVADSGHTVERGFCAGCGSPVAARQVGGPAVWVYAASLDDPSGHRPTMDVWTSSAQPWDVMDPSLPNYPKGLV
jgi:hypothetical protein